MLRGNIARIIHLKLNTLLREIKEDLNIHHVHGLEDSVLLRCQFSPKLRYRFTQSQPLTPQAFFLLIFGKNG